MRILNCGVGLCMSMLAMPAMACFTVYDRTSRVVYSGMDAPIDMRYQILDRLPQAFPGGHLVFGSSPDCPSVDTRKVSPVLSNVPLVSPALRPGALITPEPGSTGSGRLRKP